MCRSELSFEERYLDMEARWKKRKSQLRARPAQRSEAAQPSVLDFIQQVTLCCHLPKPAASLTSCSLRSRRLLAHD